MASFITAPSTIPSIRSSTTSATCSINKKLFPRASRSGPMMQANFSPNDEMDDDDNPTIGAGEGPGPGYGMQAPPLSASDRIYLDGAKNNKEYMARMTEIARRLRRKKQLDDTVKPRQTPDQYIDSLSRRNEPSAEGDYGDARIAPADEYMENLGRMYRKQRGVDDASLLQSRRTTPKTTPSGPVVDPTLAAEPTDSVTELEDKMRAIQAEIEQVSRTMKPSEEESIAQEVMEKLNEMAELQQIEDVVHDVEDAVEMTLEEGARQIEELQSQIREAAGLREEESESGPAEMSNDLESEPELEAGQEIESEQESDPEPTSEASAPDRSLRQSHIGKDTGTVDKQIEFLESYLSKLQREAAEDPEARESKGVPQEPKRDIVEEAQAAMSTVAEQISKLPNERTSFEGLDNTPGEMSAQEKMAIFEELRRRAAGAQPSSEFADPFNVTLPERKVGGEGDYGDEPSPESEAEYDSFDSPYQDKSLLIEEIETEVKAYSRDVKAMLQKHETRLQVLLARLGAL